MKLSSIPWRGVLLAAGLVVLGISTRPALPFDLRLVVTHGRATLPGELAPVSGVELDLALGKGGSTVDAIYSVSRDGHMHFGLFKGGRHLYS